jgi:hypothetical protein
MSIALRQSPASMHVEPPHPQARIGTPDAQLRADARGRDGSIREELAASSCSADRDAAAALWSRRRLRLSKKTDIHACRPSKALAQFDQRCPSRSLTIPLKTVAAAPPSVAKNSHRSR